jgi:D-serine deaminase-like pyridoxal phosphate-dependent protein
MKYWIVGVLLMLVSASSGAVDPFFDGTYRVGDPIATKTFCVSAESMALGIAKFITNKPSPEDAVLPPGCLTLGMQPMVLVQRVGEGMDYENDHYEVWKARETFRNIVYVILWDRPSMPIPRIFLGA